MWLAAGGSGAAVAHRWDLAVEVLSRRAGEYFPEPRDQACDVSVYLPALKTEEHYRKNGKHR